MRVFANLGKINAPLPNSRAYLIRCATNLWIDRLRRASLERAHAAPSRPSRRRAADASQVVDVRAAANSLFLHLAPQERAAVLLAEVLDFSLEETASMLKTTVGAVKSALHRGRARLKAAAGRRGARVDGHAARGRGHLRPRLTPRTSRRSARLCLADVTVDMVGGASFDGYETARPPWNTPISSCRAWARRRAGRSPSTSGEPIAIGFRTLNGAEGLNEVWRSRWARAGVWKLRLYCFTPDVLVAVARGPRLPRCGGPTAAGPTARRAADAAAD
jgi:RNA polymerase sigma-70 factor (ECF subfamily)